MSSEKLNQAISAIKLGDKATGSRLLNDLLLNDESQNELAWIWLATCYEHIGDKENCLKKALAINPNNQVVIYALSKLERPWKWIIENITHQYYKKIPVNSEMPSVNEITLTRKHSRLGIASFGLSVINVIAIILLFAYVEPIPDILCTDSSLFSVLACFLLSIATFGLAVRGRSQKNRNPIFAVYGLYISIASFCMSGFLLIEWYGCHYIGYYR